LRLKDIHKSLLEPLPPYASPSAMAITHDGKTLYVVDSRRGGVTPIYTESHRAGPLIRVGGGPDAIAVPSDKGSTGFVASYRSGTVTPFNVSDGVAGTAIKGFHQPVAIAVAPDGRKAYVVNQGSGTVTVVTIPNGKNSKPKIGRSIPVGGLPISIAITPDGSTAYVARQGNVVMAINLANDNTTQILVPRPGSGCRTQPQYQSGLCGFGRPVAIAIPRSGDAVYVTGAGRGWMTPIRVPTEKVLGPIHIWNAASQTPPRPGSPAPPMPIAISPNGKFAYVTNFYQSLLYRITLPIK
jgi:YVTN family beta-propeller protein